MKNKLFFLLLSVCFIYAGVLDDFKNKNYSIICNIKKINSITDEKVLSLVGISCVKTDRLYLLPFIIKKLKHTKIGRLNSIYLLTIYMQKKLLYSFVFDNLNLDSFNLPDTDYIISHVFYKIKRKEYKKLGDKLIINYNGETIKVYKEGDKLFIDEYKNNKLIKRHWFR